MNRQQGVSLISLMIGLLVSMIVVLGMMTVFRNTIQTVVPASEAARSDGERVSGLLAAHMMLHDAGFGIEDLTGALVVLGSNAALAGETLSGNELSIPTDQAKGVVWGKGFDTDADGEIDTFLCEGLLADGTGGLRRLSSDESCTNASTQWNSLDWTSTPLIRDAEKRAEDDFEREITITVEKGVDCTPFGIDIDGSDIAVTLSYPVNVGGDEQIVSSTTCLANF